MRDGRQAGCTSELNQSELIVYSTGFNRAFGEERPGPVPLIPTPLCHPQPRGCPSAMTAQGREEERDQEWIVGRNDPELEEREEEDEEDEDLNG